MLLAQAGSNSFGMQRITSTGALNTTASYTARADGVGAFLALGLPLLLIAGVFIFFWLWALISAIKRHDLKESKLLWVVVILFLPIGYILYFFIEDRKKMGWASILVPVILFSLVGGLLLLG